MNTFFNFIILILSIALALCSIGVLIVIHEFGHYWIAKRFGVHIETFSLGFGRPLYQWHNKAGTLFKIGWIPLGGFVTPHGQHKDANNPTNPSISYAHKKNWQRSLIILAGPAINLLCALILYWGLFWVGLPYLKPVISTPPPNTPAFNAGLRNHDRILSINGHKIVSWKNLLLPILRHYGHSTSLPITILRHKNQRLVKSLNLSNLSPHPQGNLWQSTGLIPPLTEPTLTIDRILPQSTASLSDLQPKDTIISINNHSLKQGSKFQKQLKRFAGSTVTIQFKRKKQQLQTSLKITQPISSTGVIMTRAWPPHTITILKYPFFQALKYSFLEIQYNITLNAVFIKQLLRGYLSTHLLRGPISLLSITTEAIAQGLLVFAYFMAYVNIALAVFNLLPLPGLDGGHLILTLIESIRRKPLSLRIQRNWALTGFVLLASLLLLISLQDLKRLFL